MTYVAEQYPTNRYVVVAAFHFYTDAKRYAKWRQLPGMQVRLVKPGIYCTLGLTIKEEEIE